MINSSNHFIECFVENEILDTNLTLGDPVSAGSNLFTMFCSNGRNSQSLNLSTTIFVQSKKNSGI